MKTITRILTCTRSAAGLMLLALTLGWFCPAPALADSTVLIAVDQNGPADVVVKYSVNSAGTWTYQGIFGYGVSAPYGITADSSGYVYVAENNGTSGRLVKYPPNGGTTPTLVVSNSAFANGYSVGSLHYGPDGNLYAAVYGGTPSYGAGIWRLNTSGGGIVNFIPRAGTGWAMTNALDFTFFNNGGNYEIHVADRGATSGAGPCVIERFSLATGAFLGNLNSALIAPNCIYYDAGNNLDYVGTWGGSDTNRICSLNPVTGTYTPAVNQAGTPQDMTRTAGGLFWLANSNPGYIYSFASANPVANIALDMGLLQTAQGIAAGNRWTVLPSGGSASGLIWNGNVNGDWNTSGNWLLGGAPATYGDGATVIMDDSASGTTSLTLGSTVQPSSVTVQNFGKPYTLNGAGSIGGAAATLTKANGSTFTLNTANTYGGPTYIYGGKLVVNSLPNGGVAGPLGQSSANPTNLVLAGGVLSYQGPSAATDRGWSITAVNSGLEVQNDLRVTGSFAGLSGATLLKSGPGKLIYANSGSNCIAPGNVGGAYSVAQGTVVMDGTTGPGQTNVVVGDIWVGMTTNASAALILSNSTLGISGWLALGRGNGAGNLSTATLYDSALSCAGLTLGYWNNLSNNLCSQVLTLNGNSKLVVGGSGFPVGESSGSFGTLYFKDTASVTSASPFRLGATYAMPNLAPTGAVYVTSSAVSRINSYASIGAANYAVGTMALSNNANWTVTSDFNVSDNLGSSGTFYIADNAQLAIGNGFYVGKSTSTTGIVYQTGGTISRSAGTTDWRIGGTSPASTNAYGAYYLSGGALNIGNGNFQVGGQAAIGLFSQTGGTVTCLGYPSIGRWIGGTGTYNISAGSFSHTDSGKGLIIGEAGTGVLNLSGSGQVSTLGWLSVGHTATGIGTVNLTSGLVGINGALYVGNASGAVATFNVNGGLLVTTNNPIYVGHASGATGSLSLNGGTVITKQITWTAGSGTLFLNGATLQSDVFPNTPFLTGIPSVYVMAGGAVFNATADLVISQDLNDGASAPSPSAGGGLTKNGPGSLTLNNNLYYTGPTVVNAGNLILNGNNNYSGPTVINGGKVAATTLNAGIGNYTLAGGTEFSLKAAYSIYDQLNVARVALGTVTGSTLDLDFGFGNAAAAVLNITDTLTANGVTTVNLTGANFTVGQFPFIAFNTRAGNGTFALGTLPPGIVGTIVTNVSGHSIDLIISAVKFPVWSGQNSWAWDINGTQNWIDLTTGLPSYYGQGNVAIFDDSGLTNTVSLQTAITPGGVTFSNALNAYTLVGPGKLGGNFGLTKYGAAAVTLAETNEYTGPTTVNEGTLVAAIAKSLPATSALTLAGGTLDLSTNNPSVGVVNLTNGTITGANVTLTAPAFNLQNGTVGVKLAGTSATLTTFGDTNNLISLAGGSTYSNRTVLKGAILQVNNLANGGQPSAIGASSASPTNLVFFGGTLSYSGPAVAINRGYSVTNGGGVLDLSGDLTLGGQVLAADGGTFTKTGPAKLTYTTVGTNILSVAGGGGAFNVVNGTAVFDGASGSQSNYIGGELWVGSTPDYAAKLVLTNNTSLTVSSWMGVGRGNGFAGNLSSVTLYNSTLTLGALSMGYWNNIPNTALQALTLNGTSRLLVTATGSGSPSFYVAESSGSTATLTLNDSSKLTSLARVWLGCNSAAAADCYGELDLTGTSSMNVSNYMSIGSQGGRGAAFLKDSASLTITSDFNVTDHVDSQGSLSLSNNAAVTVNNTFVGKNTNTVGTVNQYGGTFNANAFGGTTFQIGQYGQGTWNLFGGTVYAPATLSLGRYAIDTNAAAFGTGTLNVSGGSFNVTNLYVGDGGVGTLNLSSTGVVNCTNQLYLGNAPFAVGTVNLDGGTLLAKQVLTGNAAATSTLNFNGGLLRASAGATADFLSGLTAANVKAGGANIDSAGNSLTIAQPLLDAGGGGLTKLGTGTLSLSGANTSAGQTTVANGTLLANGTLVGPVQATGGTLGGNGTIHGAVTIGASGTLAPGSSLGSLTINNTLTLGGATVMEISRNGSVLANDAVVGLTQVSYGGTLLVTNIGPSSLQVGDTFKLFTASSYAGAGFTSVVLPGPYIWNNRLTVDGTIQVSGLGISTVPTNITAVVSNGKLQLSWPADHKGWTLEAQTNSPGLGLTNHWTIVPGSTSTNWMDFPMNAAAGSVFYRMRYP
jgi:fibronectin-binding autotransporter adhesin